VSIALVAGAVLFSLAVLELGCRLLSGGPAALVHWPNYARAMMGIDDGGCNYVSDSRLGWSLPPSCSSPGYDTDANGFRRVPARSPAATAALAQPPVLATGSSFTWGHDALDGETWPAFLQAESGRQVLNAGVSGYALDQTVLQTEQSAARLKPLVIVAGFTPGDVWRTELSLAYSREKPYFVLTNGQLELRGVPIAPHPRAPLPPAARWLGWSALANEIVDRLGIRDGWYYEEIQAVPPGTGETIACLLMGRLARLGVPVLVVAQYGRGYWEADAAYRAHAHGSSAKVLGCAAAAGLAAFDLAPPLQSAIEARGLPALYSSEHHTPEGNRTVAELIYRELVRRNLLPQAATR
jgi:hypothetical protein